MYSSARGNEGTLGAERREKFGQNARVGFPGLEIPVTYLASGFEGCHHIRQSFIG